MSKLQSAVVLARQISEKGRSFGLGGAGGPGAFQVPDQDFDSHY
jgi:hypothetical protein